MRISFLLTAIIISVQCGGNDYRAHDNNTALTLLYPGDETYFGHCVYAEPRCLVFDPLLDYDSEGNFVGRLAESWEHSPDFRTWKIRLHEEAKWHDGVPVTSHDIKFTFDLLTHPDVSMLNSDDFSVEILDDKTFVITCSGAPYYSPMDEQSFYYPKHLLENLDPKEFCSWPYWSSPIGNGPYRIVRFTPKTFVELEVNPDYYLERPKIERLVLKFAWPPLTELLSGNVDVAVNVNRNDVLKLEKDARFESYYRLGSPHAIFWNHSIPKFSDPRVREALTRAINRKELYNVLNLPEDVLVFDVPWVKDQYMRGDFPSYLPFDPEKAKKLLDDAGWIDSDGDGIRERDGEDFHFTMIARASNQQPAVYVQDQLRRVGIVMDISALGNPIVRQRFVSGDFDAILYVFKGQIGERVFGKDYPPMGYQNDRVAALFTASLNAWGEEELNTIYRELWTIFQRDLPVTFIRPVLWTYVARKRVKGLRTPDKANPLFQMRYLWIEDKN